MKTIPLALALLTLALPAAAQRLAVSPAIPGYGQDVAVEIKDAAFPVYLPATRYVRSGNTIVIEYEYLQDGFGPVRPDFGASLLSLGELPPGNYSVQARLFDIARPTSPPTILETNVPVVPPGEWGVYSVPQEPLALAKTAAVIRSAAYFDPASMRVSVAGNVIRVDFTYRSDAPAGGPPPAGLTTFASIDLPALQPGTYVLEGWARTSDTAPKHFFTRSVNVASSVPVVEYYSAGLDHYFISAGSEEIALLDRGGNGDWRRTGQQFTAWSKAADAPPGAVPVCRFYAAGPNSHFYTGSRQECDYLKALEQSQRAEAQSRGRQFLGWGYETIAFWAILPTNGQCPAGLKPVYRAFNDRVAQMDANHRFTTDGSQRAAMSAGWIDEGTHLCAG
jgi:hypothetical protein